MSSECPSFQKLWVGKIKSWVDFNISRTFWRRPVQQMHQENSQIHTTLPRDRWRLRPRRTAYPLAKAKELNHQVFCCRIWKTARLLCNWPICSDESPGDDVAKSLVSGDFSWCSFTHQTKVIICTNLSSAWTHEGGHRGTQRVVPNLRATAVRTASSSRRSPQAVIGNARSQSPLWGADAVRKEAFSCSFDKLDSAMALSAKIPGLSQKDCLPESGWFGGGLPNIVDQRGKYEAIRESGWRAALDNMIPWKGSEAAAEAKKAGSASEDTVRMPRPPTRIGSPDWINLLSGREQFVILHTADLSILSNKSRASCPTDGEHLKRCWTRGALNDARSRTKASLERPTDSNDQQLFQVQPVLPTMHDPTLVPWTMGHQEVEWNWKKTENNFRWRSTKLFCFSIIFSSPHHCETECWNKFKSGRDLSNRPCR